MGTVNVCEFFTSFQGEGTYLGQPSFFLRTSGCNLRCKWGDTLCDTAYASWEPETNLMSVADVLAKIQAMKDESPMVNHVVVTGGEPFMQEDLGELLVGLKAMDLFITVESNGTTHPIEPLPIDLISLSPKLSTSTPMATEFEDIHRTRRINVGALKRWVDNYNYQFKFVIFEESDEAEILEILNQLGDVPPERVFLMPEGVDMSQLRVHAIDCFDIARRHGWRYTPRAHIEIFGDSRGK